MNRFFHYKDRGGTLGGEILAGLSMLFLSACGIFVNIQLIAKLRITGEYASASASEVTVNGEIYAQAWFLCMMIAFVGSLLLGLIARLPLVQIGGLGLSTVLVSMVGASTGLSYYNLLYVCFVSSIVYTALVAIPGVKQWIFKALPKPVRSALPAAVGLLMAWIAIQLTGIINVNSSSISIYGAGSTLEAVNETVSTLGIVSFGTYSYSTDLYHPLLMVSAIAVIATFVLYLILRQRTKRPFLFSTLLGTVVFLALYVFMVCFSTKTFKFSLDSLWGRLWMVGSEDAMQTHLSTVLSSIKFGRIFSSGSDFTKYTDAGGNVALLFATAILNFVFINMYEAQAVLQVTADDTKAIDANEVKGVQLALIVNGLMNIVAPMYGAVPVGVSPVSVAGSKDGGKSGLASIVCAVGLAASAFFWIFPFLFATSTSYSLVFNLYGHYGTCMQLMCETAFVVADAVMVILGLSMAAKSLRIDWMSLTDTATLAVTVVATFLFTNLAAGVAAGTLAYVVVSVTAVDPTKKKAKKSKKARKANEGEAPVDAIAKEKPVETVSEAPVEEASAEDAPATKTIGFKGVSIQEASWAIVSIVLLYLLMK